MIIGITAGVLLGLTTLLLAAPIARSSAYADRVADWYLSTSMATFDRPTVVVSPTTDISIQSRRINDQFQREELPGDPSILLSITRNSAIRCGNRALTFVDGQFGVSFDLRDVVAFDKLSELDSNGVLSHRIENTTESGQIQPGPNGVTGFVRAVARVDDRGDGALTMDLDTNVREWIEGNEDATAWHRVWKGVERMFSMRGSALSWLKSLVPVLALIAGLFAAYYLVGPGSLPGAPNSREIGVGAGSLLLLGLFGGDDDGDDNDDSTPWYRFTNTDTNTDTDTHTRENTSGGGDRDDDSSLTAAYDTRTLIGAAGGVLVSTVALVLALIAPGVIDSILIALIAAVSTVVLARIISSSLISSLPQSIRDPIATIWLSLALQSHSDPIFYQTEKQTLELRDADALGLSGSGPRYRVAQSLVGFDVSRSVDSFGTAGIRGAKLGVLRSTQPQHQINAIPDGGAESVIGVEDYEITEQISNAGNYGVIPTHDSLDSDARGATWIRTDKWMSRLADSAKGAISEQAQLEATKEFADGDGGFSDQQLMYLSLGASIAGFVGGAGLWAVLL